MKRLLFQLYFCTMLGEYDYAFPKEVQIWPPQQIVEKSYYIDEHDRATVSDFVESIKSEEEIVSILGVWEMNNLSFETIYVRRKDCFLGLRCDKNLIELFSDFEENEIELAHFFVPGGASIQQRGYRFSVHPDEKVHEHSPHVHVAKDGISVRYSLETMERFKQDKPPREYLRDEKKIILPFLAKHRDQLMGYWNHYMRGYLPPTLDLQGKQFYRES